MKMEVYTPNKFDFEEFAKGFKPDGTPICIEHQLNDAFRDYVIERRKQIAIEYAKNNYVEEEEDYENVVVEFGPTKKCPRQVKVAPVINIKFNVVPKFVRPLFAPFADIETYIWCNKFTPEQEARVRELYTPPPSEPVEISKKVKYDVPDDPLHVFVNFKCMKNNTIKIKITVPMEPVIEYQKKAKLAPIEVRVKAYKAFGYPDSVLLKMMEYDDMMKKKEPEMTKFINSIFGETTKKTSKPKVRSMHEIITKQMNKKAPVDKYE